MPIEQTIQVLMFLLPGFITELTKNALVVTRDLSYFDRMIKALTLTIINFYVLKLFFPHKSLPLINPLAATHTTSLEVFLSIGIALVLGAIWAFALNQDYLYRILRFMKLTKKTGRYDLWQDVFIDNDGSWVKVILNDGTEILGYAKDFSDLSKKRELFIGDASINSREIDGPGVYVSESSGIKLIQLLRGEGKKNIARRIAFQRVCPFYRWCKANHDHNGKSNDEH